MRKLALIAFIGLAGCTVHYTPDIERFHTLDSAINTKADAEVTGKNFKFLADQMNALRQDVNGLKAPQTEAPK